MRAPMMDESGIEVLPFAEVFKTVSADAA
jgi:hypothetical protein